MIVLDTHILIWWVHGDAQLSSAHEKLIRQHESSGLGVSAISLWEIAKLVELKRLVLPCPIKDWFDKSLAYPGIAILDLTPEIAIESTQLPGNFHKDPADQIIVATARILQCDLLTADQKLRKYAHVNTPPK